MTTAGQAQRQRDRWRSIGILVGGLALAVGFGIQLILLIPTTYTATSAVALRPLSADVPADSVEMLAHEYGVSLSSAETADLARADGGSDSANDADVSVSTVQDPGTATVRIVVESTSRTAAIEAANELASYAVTQGEDDTTTRVVPVVEAGVAGVTAVPPRKLYIAALLCLAALVLAGGLYRIRERT
jgi:capsular polysaccharide biosynthesis protein